MRCADPDLVRCPRCKGRLEEGARALRCVPCRTSHPWIDRLDAWDFRCDAHLDAGALPGPSWSRQRHAARMWQALHRAHDELPRQGVIAWLDLGDPAAFVDLEDAFARSVLIATSPERLLAARRPPRLSPAVVALVDADALPLASRCIDLFETMLGGWEPTSLEARLAEVHRVLGPGGHARWLGGHRGASFEAIDRAARAAFGAGFAWPRTGGFAAPGASPAATLHRHVQTWLGFEYTLGRGIQAARRSVLARWLGRVALVRELVCWRTRPDAGEWKRTPSHVPMVFGRFGFPRSAPSS